MGGRNLQLGVSFPRLLAIELQSYGLYLLSTIFSFAGIPPLVGFFAKQMVLSAALYGGYFVLSLIAILTSVIGGVYFLM